ncbi:SDR family NAD(P)-dependent oxidoreductase [Sandaracinus amylolyticus]|uniref:3-oxoacyl-[acyl-carrier protein] reductase n=1 Tax=Sandaracinus amylolyticus TaxID=927083 RepID=A0A0F6YGS5_9BACT|nr:SDR family oxidoreductase [Sandaracinus amylolyticus]AKF04263.1 3-oxoacyl-[acyl-carrier protein] reductase [Sandaracinus amylolyticus]
MKRLEDRVVIVTGGSRGLGRAIAIEAAAEGARVVVAYRRREREAREVVDAIGPSSCAIAVDVRDVASVDRLFAQVLETHGRVDGLVTSAGIVSDGWLATLPIEQWDDVVTTNLRGTMATVRAALRPMIARKSGAIVALSSIAASRASPGQASYAATKGAIESMARTLAAEVARHGVRVNALAPGLIDAGMVKATPLDRVTAAMTRIPLGRLGRAREIARAAVFLLSDDASYVTGHTLVVDGGLSA